MGSSGPQSDKSTYLYALLGVVSVVAFVAIFIILRSGTPMDLGGDALTGNIVAIAPGEPIETTLGEGVTGTYVFNGVDYVITPIIITSDNRVKFSVNGEVTRSLLAGESGGLSNGMKITVVSVNRMVADIACPQPECAKGENCPAAPCTTPQEIVTVTFRFEEGKGLPNTPPPYVIIPDTLREGETKTYTVYGHDYEITLAFVPDDATSRPYVKFIVNNRLSNGIAPGEGQLNLISDRVYLYVNDVLTSSRDGMVEFYIYDRRYIRDCFDTGSNVNLPANAICCNGMATQVPTCPGGAALDCAGRRLYCEGNALRSKAVGVPTSGGPYIGGNTAFNLYFQNGAPPTMIYDAGKFPFAVNVVVENVGEVDIGPGTTSPYATMRLEGILPQRFGVTEADIRTTITERVDGMKKQSDGTVVPGQVTNVVFSGLNYQGVLQEDQQLTLRGTFCHDYRSKAIADICFSGGDCENGEKAVFTSAGPILVSGVTQSKVSDTKQLVSFTISHAGYGAVFARADGEDCDANINNPNKDKMIVSVIAENTVARCGRFDGGTSGAVTLFNGAPQTITCEFEWQDKQPPATDIPIMITIDYRYGQSIEQPITIRHVENGGAE